MGIRIVEQLRERLSLIHQGRLFDDEDIQGFRKKLFHFTIICLLCVGTLLYVPAMIFGVRNGMWTIVMIDTLVYLSGLAVFFLRRFSFHASVSAGLLMFYVMSLALLLGGQSLSVGIIWLFSFPIFSGVLLGMRYAFLSLGVNIVTALVLGWLIGSGSFVIDSGVNYSDVRWVSLFFHFVLLNGVVTLMLSQLIKGLRKSFQKERSATWKLEEERQKLLKMNERLKKEVSERMRAEEALFESEEKASFYASHDPLTSLSNRSRFMERMEEERQKCDSLHTSLSLIIFRIDRFKEINDIYGRDVGDMLLKEVSHDLQTVFPGTVEIGRFGGNRFCILIPSSDRLVGDESVKMLFGIFSHSFMLGGNDIKTSCSAGIAQYPDDGETGEILVNNAETAMRMARNQGGAIWHNFDLRMNVEMISRIRMEKEMMEGIVNDEFFPYYQPKVDNGGKIVGMEALIRWKSPNRKGLIQPGRFIPLAEENGMICEIGNIVLRKSCIQMKIWHEMGIEGIRVSVNLSPQELKQPDLIGNIMEILDSTRLDPGLLELEITESGIMENERESVRKLNEIKSIGISISVDDFGTGYSSLAKIKDYPIDVLKVDKSFVDNLPDDPKSATIAKTIIDLGHSLGFKVVAEGVEDERQLEYLKERGCDIYQGYYFSKPVSAEDFEQMVRDRVQLP